MQTIVVTGATGFVGQHVLRALCEMGRETYDIVGTSYDSRAAVPHGVSLVPLDITDADAVADLIGSVKPVAVIHLAGVAEPGRVNHDRGLGWSVNFGGTINLADAILRCAPDCRLIFSSSSEVYGASFLASHKPINEDVCLRPMNAYASSKAISDIVLGQMAFEGLNCIRFRSFNHCGPGQSSNYVVPSFAEQVALIEAGKMEPVIKVGNLSARRDFLDVRDVSRAYISAIDVPIDPKTQGCINLASGSSRRIGDILEALVAMSSASVRIEVEPARLRPIDIDDAFGDPSRAFDLLGWSPKIPFEQTLADVLNYFRGLHGV